MATLHPAGEGGDSQTPYPFLGPESGGVGGCHGGRAGTLEKGCGHSELGTYKTTHPCLSIPCRPPRQTCAWARASIHPYSCTLAPQRPSPPPSLMAQITFLLQDLGGSRLPSPSLRPSLSPGGLQSGPVAAFGAAASIPAPVSLPPNTLSSAPSASPLLLGAPPHCCPLPPLSVPNLVSFIPLSIRRPQVPGHPSPSPCPATLGFSVSRPATPPLSPHPTSPHQASPISTSPYLACRAPAPPCRAPPGAGGGRRRDRDRGEPNRALPQRQPRLRVRPQTRPRPQTHPSTPSEDGVGALGLRCAARLG